MVRTSSPARWCQTIYARAPSLVILSGHALPLDPYQTSQDALWPVPLEFEMAGNFLAACERPAILNRALRPADFTWFAKAREGEQALIFARFATSQSADRCYSDGLLRGLPRDRPLHSQSVNQRREAAVSSRFPFGPSSRRRVWKCAGPGTGRRQFYVSQLV